MASEEGRFAFDDCVRSIVEKLVRRHPHVFGSENAADSDAVLTRWEEIKRAEKGDKPASALDGISEGLPGLMRAEKVQKRAAKVGFDWSELPPVFAKVREELAEVEGALGDADRVEDEVGDLLFAVVNLSRKLKTDGEVALQRATDKFSARFRAVESLVQERGLAMDKMSLAELDVIWEEVKRRP
jgi:MazG family protein